MSTLALLDSVPGGVGNISSASMANCTKASCERSDNTLLRRSSSSESEDDLTNSPGRQDSQVGNFKEEIDNDIVAVTVGTALHNSTTLYVHKHLLCSYSFFFKLICSSSGTSSVLHQVELPEEDPTIFSIFVEWLYTRSIEILNSTSNIVEYIIPIYALADRLRATALKNSLIDLLVVLYSEEANMLDISDIVLIYANTSTGSGLRRWAVDEYPRSPENIYNASWDNYGKQCPEFFFDFAKASFNGQVPMPNPASDPRRYHDHDGVTHAGCCTY